MPALSFRPRFVQPILYGVKDQTIRMPRKAPIKVGDTLPPFTGMRTKTCKEIAAVTCTEGRINGPQREAFTSGARHAPRLA